MFHYMLPNPLHAPESITCSRNHYNDYMLPNTTHDRHRAGCSARRHQPLAQLGPLAAVRRCRPRRTCTALYEAAPPWRLIFITALARGVPTGHLQPHFLGLTDWPLAEPVPFGYPPCPGDTVFASGRLPAAPSLDTAWMSPSPSLPSLSLPSLLPSPGVAWASAASGRRHRRGRRRGRRIRQILDL